MDGAFRELNGDNMDRRDDRLYLITTAFLLLPSAYTIPINFAQTSLCTQYKLFKKIRTDIGSFNYGRNTASYIYISENSIPDTACV